jgi:hypothetical protein
MSTSELYHIQGVKEYTQVGKVVFEGHSVIYTIVPQEKLIRCPDCGSYDVIMRGFVTRKLRAVPVYHRKDIFLDTITPRTRAISADISVKLTL